jgi:hypothetical protein
MANNSYRKFFKRVKEIKVTIKPTLTELVREISGALEKSLR